MPKKLSERIEGYKKNEAFLEKIFSEQSDRAFAIVACAFLEDGITEALQELFKITRIGEARAPKVQSDLFQKLFDNFGPLSSFSGKILIMDALGLLSADAKRDLLIIKDVRNQFAHDSLLEKFSDQEVSDRCNNLVSWQSAHRVVNKQKFKDDLRLKYIISILVIVTEIVTKAQSNVELFKQIVPTGVGALEKILDESDA